MVSETNHSAKGTAAGILFQPERVLLWLSQALPKGARVGLEVGNDVTVQMSDEEVSVEENKHSTSDYQPFKDNGVDLWKSLANWAEDLERETVLPSKLSLYLVTNSEVKEKLVTLISDAETDEEVKTAITAIRSHSPTKTTKKHHVKVINLSDEKLQLLVRSVKIIDNSPQLTQAAGKDIIAANLHLPEGMDIDDVINSLYGWICMLALEAWRENKSAWITIEQFNRQLQTLIIRSDRLPITIRARHMLPVEPEQISQHRTRQFIRQLELVMEDRAPENFYIEAVEDFVKTQTERSRLANEGRLTKDDFIAFDGELVEEWRDSFNYCVSKLKKYDSPEECGCEIYYSTVTADQNLAGVKAPGYLIKGSYHQLADAKDVGWHPDFQKRI